MSLTPDYLKLLAESQHQWRFGQRFKNFHIGITKYTTRGSTCIVGIIQLVNEKRKEKEEEEKNERRNLRKM